MHFLIQAATRRRLNLGRTWILTHVTTIMEPYVWTGFSKGFPHYNFLHLCQNWKIAKPRVSAMSHMERSNQRSNWVVIFMVTQQFTIVTVVYWWGLFTIRSREFVALWKITLKGLVQLLELRDTEYIHWYAWQWNAFLYQFSVHTTGWIWNYALIGIIWTKEELNLLELLWNRYS